MADFPFTPFGLAAGGGTSAPLCRGGAIAVGRIDFYLDAKSLH